ncbi:MAG TPA: hypothetical protein VG826_27975 [Pirellulales bacterium]|nr:hypothetical protein [Pirellulales bacterium]
MACRIEVSGDARLPFIYSVSAHVGPGQANQPDDVELVQFLMAETLKRQTSSNLRIRSPVPQVTRAFDLMTGFWIYELENVLVSKLEGQLDGIVSPVRGHRLHFAEGKYWLIAALNLQIKLVAPTVFAGIPDNPQLSATLRASIRR